jgi:hypothetical protein
MAVSQFFNSRGLRTHQAFRDAKAIRRLNPGGQSNLGPSAAASDQFCERASGLSNLLRIAAMITEQASKTTMAA